jgi:ribosomal protein S18 acetylase RimI-like enzyme
MAIEVRPASAERWADVERLMQTPGDPETCWCQVFRVLREDWDQRPVELNRDDLRTLVESGRRPGLVAYEDDEPVGWCAVAPLTDYLRFASSPFIAAARPDGDDPSGRWMVTCFVVVPAARGAGLVETMLTAAVDHARANGAAGVEAIPLDVDRAEHVTPDELFSGTLTAFEEAGFERLAQLGPDRTLVVRRF